MSANNDPIFISQPFHWDAELSSQIFPRAGGSIGVTAPVLLGKTSDNGGVITSVSITATGNTGANVCCLFTLREGASTARLRAEVGLPAVTGASNTSVLANFPVHFTLPDFEPFEGCVVEMLKLAPSESLYCALLQAEATSKFIVHAVGGLYDQA
jgi:hypothetical protein